MVTHEKIVEVVDESFNPLFELSHYTIEDGCEHCFGRGFIIPKQPRYAKVGDDCCSSADMPDYPKCQHCEGGRVEGAGPLTVLDINPLHPDVRMAVVK